MKLVFIPELSTLAERMGVDEYVTHIWRIREREHAARESARRASDPYPKREPVKRERQTYLPSVMAARAK